VLLPLGLDTPSLRLEGSNATSYPDFNIRRDIPIDAPEGKQTCLDAAGGRYLCGSRAADALASLIGRNGRVSCQEQDRDRYGRIVAVCSANARDINGELVAQGWALEYGDYSDGRYADEVASRRWWKFRLRSPGR